MEWDVFISHASEDKDDFVAPLANSLSSFFINVWYDDFTLKIGESLSGSLDKGLSKSRYGIVVLSRNFIEKAWTDYEMRSLLSREIGYDKVILPIWHNVTKNEIMSYSPFLADKYALNTSIHPIKEITLKLIEVINPHLSEHLVRLILEEKMRTNGTNVMIKNSNHLNLSRKFRHSELPSNLVSRIMLIQKVFEEILPYSIEETLNSFKRDKNPDREIIIWEAMAATYLEYNLAETISFKQKKVLFSILIDLTTDSFNDEQENKYPHFTKRSLNEISKIYIKFKPHFSTAITAEIVNVENEEDSER